ncbi:MAG TPA: DUF6600 domain-containing protein [Candidatus Sulfotelmatobacter sp.]|nr:DUF6600 domain-containing protein [Candidatus Sulfotelmatobacter sp.]
MKKLTGKFAVLILGLSCALSLSAFAQTTDEGPGPSEQPSAPTEVGQPQPPDGQSPDSQQMDSSDAGDPNAAPTEAQPGGPTGEAPAQTDQGVARVSLIHGDVSTQRGDSGDWSAATLNQPVMTGDKVSTGDNSRVELQLDFANTLRIGPNSKANIANLTRKNIQIQLSQGLLNYTLSKDSDAEPEIDTPNVAVHPAHHDGVFRIEIRPDGDTLVIVREGQAQIATPQGSTEINAGDMATIRGDINSAQYKVSAAPDRDAWDQWNSDRDHLIRNANSWRHTNRRYTGTQDLDAYGNWQNVPDYGDVWVPNEPDGWVPYRDGNWVWEPYYGWTWVGYEPWGWAPYHYGRWFLYNNAWAWWPGPVYAGYNPFWAPAYVSFWGWGGGFGFGFGWGGWGGFGWLPTGPCDWYHPWWGGYRGRFGWMGRDHWNHGRYGGFGPLHGGNRFSNINNIHNNHIFRAMSTVNASRFGAGRVTAVAATRAQLNGAHMMAGNLPVVPTRASLSASGRAAAPGTIRNGGSQRFFGTHNNIARPVSFRQQTSALRASMQQNHVGGIPAGGRFAARGANSMQRPGTAIGGNRQAGTFNRGNGNAQAGNFNRNNGAVNSSQNRNGFHTFNSVPQNSRNGFSSAQNSRGGQSNGYRPFTPPSNTRNSQAGNMGARTGANQSYGTANRNGFHTFRSVPENNGNSFSSGQNSRGNPSSGFRPFTPPANSGVNRGGAAYGGNSGSYWNRTAPAAPRSYGSYSGGYNRGSYSRPQLDMRQPIVRPPSDRGYSRSPYNGGYGGYHASPNYGGSRGGSPGYGGSRPPSYGGGGRAPSGGGHFGGGGGGGHFGGGGGGGHSGGGGGGHSGGGGRR